MTKKEIYKKMLQTLEPFTSIGIPNEWPEKCVLTFDDDAICWKTKKPFISISYLPETDENDAHVPTINDWRNLENLYEKFKEESKRENSKKSKT